LVDTLGAPILVPRQVFDREDRVDEYGTLVSEIGDSERHYKRRSGTSAEDTDKWSRLRSIRQRTDIAVLDLTEEEDEAYTELRSRTFTRSRGLVTPLGPGEAAVIAIAENRRNRAVVDDGPARRILNERSPGTEILTTRDVLRAAAGQSIESPEAEIIYEDMLAEGYRGPERLW
jgi:predicted nucleic acid-binding protein